MVSPLCDIFINSENSRICHITSYFIQLNCSFELNQSHCLVCRSCNFCVINSWINLPNVFFTSFCPRLSSGNFLAMQELWVWFPQIWSVLWSTHPFNQQFVQQYAKNSFCFSKEKWLCRFLIFKNWYLLLYFNTIYDQLWKKPLMGSKTMVYALRFLYRAVSICSVSKSFMWSHGTAVHGCRQMVITNNSGGVLVHNNYCEFYHQRKIDIGGQNICMCENT